MRKIIALVLAFLLLLPLLCSCGNGMEKVIGSCAGYDVLYEELRYVTLTYKDLMENTYGKGIWDDPASAESYRKELTDTVWSVMLNNYTVLAACAAYGLEEDDLTSDAIQEAIDRQITQAIDEYGGRDAFEDALDDLHMTEHFLRFTLSVASLENELLYVLANDLGMFFSASETKAFYDFLTDGETVNCVYVQHIFIRNDEGDDVAENRALAAEVAQKIRTGAKTVKDYINSPVNEDISNVAPYFMVRDVYVKELEDAAFILMNEGDVSDPVETEDGFYILVRMAYDDTLLQNKLSELLKSYQWAKLEAFIDSYREKIAMELNDYGKSLDLLTID